MQRAKWSFFWMVFALAIVQLHAAIPHHHLDLYENCSEQPGPEDLSHPDIGAHHLEDLTPSSIKKWIGSLIVLHMPNWEVLVEKPCVFYPNPTHLLTSNYFRSCRGLRGPPRFV
jgi:hypothetical protein